MIASNVNDERTHGTLIALGLLVMYVPTYLKLNATVWSEVGQGLGPIILGLCVWLTHSKRAAFSALPTANTTPWGWAWLLAGSLLYVFGKSLDITMVEVFSQLIVLSAITYLWKGKKALWIMKAPLLFIIFIIPLPGVIVDAVTQPLKMAVSVASEYILFHTSYPIGREGVMLVIGPYKLLVADACSGINSIFALEAVGAFYITMVQHKEPWRPWLMAALIIPISFISNVSRVIALVLITYHFGDEMGQGYLHSGAGIMLVMVATLMIIGLDSLITAAIKKPHKQALT